MFQRQFRSVQIDAGGGSASIQRVAENGKAFVRSVDANLVRAAGSRLSHDRGKVRSLKSELRSCGEPSDIGC